MINILATPSDNYAMPCGVMLYSACVNNPKGSLHFYIVTDNSFTDRNKSLFEDIVIQYQNKISFYIVDDAAISKLIKIKSRVYTKHSYYRLFVSNIIPKDVNKILYLDCDIIVRANLMELWDFDISSYAIAAAPDFQEGNISIYNRLQYPSIEGYINAGVVILNLEYWRRFDIIKQIEDVLTNNSDIIRMHDQDILNFLFHDSYKKIPLKFNVQSGFYYKKEYFEFEYLKYKNEFEQARLYPVILHLCGQQPWRKGCTHPFKEEFFKYRANTIWKDEPLWKDRTPLSVRFFNKLRVVFKNFGVYVPEDKYDREIILK